MPSRCRRGILQLAAVFGTSLGFLLTYGLPWAWNIGPGGRHWEWLRRRASRLLGPVFDERAGPRPIAAAEYAGVAHAPLDALETGLWDAGFVRNPFSRLKVRDGDPEVGSWVFRESPLARRQLHLMLFEREAGGIDVYAHEEPSSVHPLVGVEHFDAAGQDVAAGVERARTVLSLDTSPATVEPVAGSWIQQPGADR